nr:lysozyme inhibitor LprI family protein [Sphingomonas populi]
MILTATPGHAINCGKASGRIDRMICADAALQRADAAMNAAYAGILKAAGDAGIRAMLVAGQRRWLAQRDADLGHLDRSGDAPDAGTWRGIVLKAIRDRTADLKRLEGGNPYLPHMVAVARAQRRFAARFTGGAFAGYDTSCSFLPGGDGYSYGCFGRQRYQNKDRVCTIAQDWASGSVTETHFVGRVVGGTLRTTATCSIGGGAGPSCPGPGAGGGKGWGASSAREAPPSRPLPQIDADADFDPEAPWLSACLTASDYPVAGTKRAAHPAAR